MSFAPENPYRAVGFKVVSVLLFVLMASLIKAASDEVPPGEAVFFRSFFAMPVIFSWLALRGELRTGLKTTNPLGHLWRGLIGTTAMAMSFAGLAILPLYEVKAIQYAMPLFVVILAAMMLGETVRKVRLTAVGMGMIGVLIILWPRLTAFTDDAFDPRLAFGAAIVLTGSFCAAMAQVFVRRLVETEETAAIVFWFSVTATVLSLLTLPFGWAVPSGEALVYIIGAGLMGGLGQIFLTSSYRYADASIVAPFEYASMLFAILIGLFVFDEVPTGMMLFGASIVIAAGILIILRERYLRIQRGKARRVVTKYG
ncbi:MAG: DMT family transporter [Paracoccaceae bacterium]|nr:DMT family transporter [Paracoccaceae bacterium]